MDLAPVRALMLDINVGVYGAEATVTPLGGVAIVTRGIWMGAVQEDMPIGHDFQRREPRQVFALSRVAVPSLPRGSTIVAIARGGTVAQTWTVEGLADTQTADQTRVIVKAV